MAGGSSFALFSVETSSTAKITGTVVSPITSVEATDGAKTIIDKVGTGGLVAEKHSKTEQTKATISYRCKCQDEMS